MSSLSVPVCRRRVLQLSRWLCADGGGGIQTYIESIARSLETSDIELSYAALLAGSTPVYAKKNVRLGSAGKSKWRNALSLWRWLSGELQDVDLVHIHGVTDWHFIVGTMMCRHRGVPYIVSVHGALMPGALAQIHRWPFITVPVLRVLSRWLLSGAECVVTTTESESRTIAQLSSRIRVKAIPPGVDCHRHLPVNTEPGEMAQRLRIIFIGRIEPVKSLPTLLQAMERLSIKGKAIHLDVVGKGDPDYLQNMKMLASRLGLGACITWHGYQSGAAKHALLENAHVLVLPSLSENFGFVVSEAMASGLPVVVSEGVGLSDSVRESRGGTVFGVGDVDELAKQLEEFFDPRYWALCSRYASSWARDRLSLSAMGTALSSLYTDAVASFNGHGSTVQ